LNYGVIVNIIQNVLSHFSFHLFNQTFSFKPHSSSFLLHFMLSTKRTFILFRYAYSLIHFTHLLCYTMIIYYLYHYVSHFSSLFSTNLFFFSLQICSSFFCKFVLSYLYALFFLFFHYSCMCFRVNIMRVHI